MSYLSVLGLCAAFIPNRKIKEDWVFRIKNLLQGLSCKVTELDSLVHLFFIHIFNSESSEEKKTHVQSKYSELVK